MRGFHERTNRYGIHWLQPKSTCLSKESETVSGLLVVKLLFIPVINAVILSTYERKVASGTLRGWWQGGDTETTPCNLRPGYY